LRFTSPQSLGVGGGADNLTVLEAVLQSKLILFAPYPILSVLQTAMQRLEKETIKETTQAAAALSARTHSTLTLNRKALSSVCYTEEEKCFCIKGKRHGVVLFGGTDG
jgi:hypothetical protein